MSENNYRLYCFTNMYLSAIQKGIQTAHVVSDISQYKQMNNVYVEWASSDKTIVVLEGGNQKNLLSIALSIEEFNNDLHLNNLQQFPYALFREDEDSLNDAVTAVGIILPESVYSLAKSIREGVVPLETIPLLQQRFYSVLAYSRLAN